MPRLLHPLLRVILPWLVVCACATRAAQPTMPARAAANQAPDDRHALHQPALAALARQRSAVELAATLQAGQLTSRALVERYQARIERLDRRGPALHSVIALNPNARADAAQRDATRAQGRASGSLHGIPILLKDNIESADPMPTTAGSLALARNLTLRDAPLVARLRAAGAVILGKANLSEWANIRSAYASSGWSALGGLTKNPYDLDRNPCGSSSGSAVAVSADLAAAAIGTETDGSITCPAAVLGLVGFKPTLGAIPRTGIIPISSAQDTAGPLTRSVRDAALLMNVLAGPDARDPATRRTTPVPDHLAQLTPNALQGKRFGVLQFHAGFLPQVDTLFAAALSDIESAGASLVVIEEPPDLAGISERELRVLLHDFRAELNGYLAHTPEAVETRSLEALIAFNRAHADQELPYFGQDLFVRAEQTAQDDPEELARQRAQNQKLAASAIDGWLASQHLDGLLAPTIGPAWTTDLVNGDHVLGGASTLPAVAGYPHLTVPMGQVSGLPVGLSFIGTADSDARLLGYGYAYEQRTHWRRPPALSEPARGVEASAAPHH